MFHNRHVTAIIIARGGSKGLPAKNLRPLLGKPLVAWSIDHAKAMRSVDLIALSTEDDRIAAVGRDAGIRVILRPMELANDTARVDDTMRHAVRELESSFSRTTEGRRLERSQSEGTSSRNADPPSPLPLSQGERDKHLDILLMLYGNVPVRRPGLLDTAVSILATTGCDSVQSFAPVGKHHPWWMYQMDAEGRVNWYDDHKVYRRQELPPLYVPDAAAIVLRRDVLMEAENRPAEPHAFFGRDRRGLAQNPDATVDVDTEIDLLVAEAMLKRLESR
ncbi:MAG: acylneuraminate cytidylyltransferase family protein [Phycisphaerae bacterium]|nr:acylneuraminate cytidylyltransferase family protein [Phycisphaerae bacterium]